MKIQVLGAAVIVLTAACGGGKTQLLDAAIDAQTICNPIAQTGCMTGEKCTWVIDIDRTATAEAIGHTGCVPAGVAAHGAACTRGMAATGGVDDCMAGDLCISNKCKPICDPQVIGNTAAGSCGADFGCVAYAGYFDVSGRAAAGVCEATCDPVTQRLKVGTTKIEACGSDDPAEPTATCVFGNDPAKFVCAPSGPDLYAKTDREEPLLNPAKEPYPNGCAPGYYPFFLEAIGSNKTLCTGFCIPVKMDMKIATSADTPANIKPWGDTNALGKLPTDAMARAGNAVCTMNVKGSIAPDANGKGVEDCRFLWGALTNDDPSMAEQSPYNDTLGFCFAYNKFLRVGMARLPEKSCAELPDDSVQLPADDPYGHAKDWGCYPLAESRLAGERRSLRGVLASMRLPYRSERLARHVFD